MKGTVALIVIAAIIGVPCNAYVPQLKSKAQTSKGFGLRNDSGVDLKRAAMASFTAFTIASNIISAPVAEALDAKPSFPFGSSNVVAEKVTRQGVYGEYEVDIVEQQRDDARSTFKDAKETKSKKGKYTALLAVLVVGSFVIPMAQYFWYVKDDDSSDRFFAEDIPDPEPKKKGWF